MPEIQATLHIIISLPEGWLPAYARQLHYQCFGVTLEELVINALKDAARQRSVTSEGLLDPTRPPFN